MTLYVDHYHMVIRFMSYLITLKSFFLGGGGGVLFFTFINCKQGHMQCKRKPMEVYYNDQHFSKGDLGRTLIFSFLLV